MENLLVTHHARDRVIERGISQAQVYAVLKKSVRCATFRNVTGSTRRR